MKIVTDLKRFDKAAHPKLVVAVGNFDGVHLGHQQIIKTVVKKAKAIGGSSAVFTFKEHPQRVLHQKEDPPILTSLIHKLYLLKKTEIDFCFLIDFTLELSRYSPEEFVKNVLIERLGADVVCLGFNAKFGRNRSGDSHLMQELANKFQFSFSELKPFKVDEQIVSTSIIRSLVHEGKLDGAARLLGRPYSFFGTLISGSGRGKGLGYPTANLDPHSEVLPPEGVYATLVRILDCYLEESDGFSVLKERVVGGHLKALMNYGRRPTFGVGGSPVPEVHILDEYRDLSDKTVEVVIGQYLRSEQAFDNQQALQAQIKQDVQAGNKWFVRQILN